MGWGSRRQVVLGACVAALAMAGTGAAVAGPVEVEDRSTAWIVDLACARWVEPQVVDGDLVGYLHHEACGNVQDRDGDGVVGPGDSRYAVVWSAVCNSPEHGSWCGPATGDSWNVSADELSIDVDGGTAALHSTSPGGCRVDLDWSGGPASSESGPGPATIDSTDDPMRVTLHQRSSARTSRDASVSGSACVSTAAPGSGAMSRDVYGDRYTGVTVDPTA